MSTFLAVSAWAQDEQQPPAAPLKAVGETVYISDILYVPLRSGRGNEYRIVHAGLKSGMPLTRLEVSDDGEWSRVSTAKGTEGWIRNQYIAEDKTAQIKLDETLSTLARLEQQNQELREKVTSLSGKASELSSTAVSESRARAKLEEELQKIKNLSANAIALDKRYSELLEKYEMTQTQRDSLAAENENLLNDKHMSFLLYGGGLVSLGMFLAVIIPALVRGRQRSEWR